MSHEILVKNSGKVFFFSSKNYNIWSLSYYKYRALVPVTIIM